MPSGRIEGEVIAAFAADGAVCLRGLFADWVDVLAAGVARNGAQPSEFFDDNGTADDPGRFWDDYCNWQHIPDRINSAAIGPASDSKAKRSYSGMTRARSWRPEDDRQGGPTGVVYVP